MLLADLSLALAALDLAPQPGLREGREEAHKKVIDVGGGQNPHPDTSISELSVFGFREGAAAAILRA